MDTTAILKDGKRMGTATIARFDFDTQKGEQILVNTALSGVSMEGAAKNLQTEVPENDFDKYLAETKANWNRQLGKIEIKGDNENDKVNFYTALYHSMIAPTIYSDVDGAYYGPDKKVHQPTAGLIIALSPYGIHTVPPTRSLLIPNPSV